MKVMIIYDKKLSDKAETVYKTICEASIPCEKCEAEDVWNEKKFKNPTNVLVDVSHVLFVYKGKEYQKSPAFLFCSGLAVGMEREILVLYSSENPEFPANCKLLGSIINFSNLDHYLSGEKKRMTILEQREKAKQDLEERGFPCFNRNFILAVEENEADIVRLFLKAGFNPSLCNSDGTPLLSIAVRHSFDEVVRILVEGGADVNAVSEDRSYTALMEAAQIGAENNVRFLLEHHAGTDTQSKTGQTALILSVGRQDEEIVKLLAKHHADASLKDNMGMSAIAYAKLFRNESILTSLGIKA